MRCAGVLLGLCLLWAGNAHAFAVQYGNLFKVRAVRVRQGVPVLPLTRGKYEDVRVLDKATFALIKSCGGLGEKEVCTQPAQRCEWRTGRITPVSGASAAWRVEVICNEQWLVRFLAEKGENGYTFTAPRSFSFMPDGPKKQTQAQAEVYAFMAEKLEEAAQ